MVVGTRRLILTAWVAGAILDRKTRAPLPISPAEGQAAATSTAKLAPRSPSASGVRRACDGRARRRRRARVQGALYGAPAVAADRARSCSRTHWTAATIVRSPLASKACPIPGTNDRRRGPPVAAKRS